MYWDGTHCLCPLGHTETHKKCHVAWAPQSCALLALEWMDTCSGCAGHLWVFFLISALPIRRRWQLLTTPPMVSTQSVFTYCHVLSSCPVGAEAPQVGSHSHATQVKGGRGQTCGAGGASRHASEAATRPWWGSWEVGPVPCSPGLEVLSSQAQGRADCSSGSHQSRTNRSKQEALLPPVRSTSLSLLRG